MRNKIAALFAARGTLLQPAALELILGQPDPEALIQRMLDGLTGQRLLLTEDEVRAFLAGAPSPGLDGPPPPGRGFRVLKDVTGNSTCVGELDDFVSYFSDRMARLKRLLRTRQEFALTTPVSAIRSRRHERELKTVGMVTDIHRTPNGRIIGEIEDGSGSIRVLMPEQRARHPLNLMRDEVVGLSGSLSTDGEIFFVSSLVRPDIPVGREPSRADRNVCAAFISDIHIGSKTFLDKHWERFVAWLKGQDGRHQDYASHLEHLVIAGDVVDGIGIYPDHEEDLAIRDVYRQYQELARLLDEIPDTIQITMLPGNHDAVRPAEPQPTFPPEITRLFDSRIHFVGNPCLFQLEGVSVLAYHGMSIADFISAIPNLSFNTPLEVMKEMLCRRHLAPVYGDKTPLAPERRDWMVIDTVPDIFVTGHVHASGVEDYRGVVLINASTWQSQTDYQRMMNFRPQPGRVAVVNLQNLHWRLISFEGQP